MIGEHQTSGVEKKEKKELRAKCSIVVVFVEFRLFVFVFWSSLLVSIIFHFIFSTQPPFE